MLVRAELELDDRPGRDLAVRDVRLVDRYRAEEPRPERPDPSLEQALLVLRSVVLEVLGEVAVLARGLDRLHDASAARPLELGELGLERRPLGLRQVLRPVHVREG